MFLFIYVNDIVVTGSDDNLVRNILDKLDGEFAIWELGALNYFLGIHVPTTNNVLHLTQGQYLFDLLKSCNLNNP